MPVVEKILLAFLVLVPITFSRWTEDAWDFPKGELLTTGGLLLAGWGLAAELARVQRLGLGKWAGTTRARFASLLRRDLLGAAMLLFLLSSVLSTFASPNRRLSLFGTHESYAGLLVGCATTAVYFAARSLAGRVASLVRVARAAALAAAIASVYGLIQLTGHDPFKWGLLAYVGGLPRVVGTMGQPNLLGAYLVMSLPLVAWLAVRSRTNTGRAAWGVLGVLCLVAIGATLSRASWVALAACAVIGPLLYFKAGPARDGAARRLHPAVAVAAGLAIALVGALVIWRTPFGSRLVARAHQIANLRENANMSRIQNWYSGFHMAARKPILGVGTDQYGLEFPAYRKPIYVRLEAGAVPVTAHNVAINILVNQGAFGALAALLVLVFAIRALARALRHPDPAVRVGAVAAATALGGFLLWDLVNYTVAALGSLAAALAGWIASADEGVTPPATGTPRAPARPTWAIVTALVLVTIAWVPLVLRPWGAQKAELDARRSNVKSMKHFDNLVRASALAPWDGRHEHQLASSFLAVALTEGDTARRIVLLKQARVAEERALKIDPRVGLFHAGEGAILMQLAAVQAPGIGVTQVEGAFLRALERDPSNPEIMTRAARALLGIGENREARRFASRCASLYPELAEPLSILGLIDLRENHPVPAADTLELALKRDWQGSAGDLARALANLSGAYLSLRRFAEAKVVAEEALKLDPRLDAAAANRDVAVQWLALNPPAPK